MPSISTLSLACGDQIELRVFDHINDQWIWVSGVVTKNPIGHDGAPQHATFQRPWFKSQPKTLVALDSVEWRQSEQS